MPLSDTRPNLPTHPPGAAHGRFLRCDPGAPGAARQRRPWPDGRYQPLVLAQTRGPPAGFAALALDPAAAQQTAAEVIHSLDLQAELPRGPEPWSWSWHWPWNIHLPPHALLILVVLLVCIAALLVFLFLAQARGDLLSVWRTSRAQLGPRPGQEPGPGTAAEVMTAADELARQGRFVEAMHALLLQGLAEIRRRLDERFADSLTSREILRSTRLPDGGRTPLRDIIARVEWTYFGEHPAGAADYDACRTSFGALAQALREEAPA